MKRDVIYRLLRQIAETRLDEIDCSTSNPQVPDYVEAVLAHRDVDGRWDAVRLHLFQCTVCEQEYLTLYQVAMQEPQWILLPREQLLHEIFRDNQEPTSPL